MVVISKSRISMMKHRPKITFNNTKAVAFCNCGWSIEGHIGEKEFDNTFFKHSQLED